MIFADGKDVAAFVRDIKPVNRQMMAQAQARLDNLTKPQGSLGKLEVLARRISAIQQTIRPDIGHKVILTFAADHGVAAEGVSSVPQEVTRQMVYNFLRGGAGVNVLARHVGAEVWVVDVGVAGDIRADGLRSRKVKAGTDNLAKGPAMQIGDALKALGVGVETAREAIAQGAKILGTGEMGIANTTPSAALFAALLGVEVEEITGRGTGIDDATLRHKIEVIKQGLRVNSKHLTGPLATLAALGGLEIAAICGMILECARSGVPVVVDGFISSAGALVALQLADHAADYCFFSHMSAEQGHRLFFEKMGLEPILDLDMRLGEGTGAALAMGIIEAGVKIINEMATFAEAGVSV
ncbi:MAG: nicotinate-nucleotide--dimethylbenzimidazole phosphoribosyltransferase [Deltaproteobacteria bacterium]|nr:nicotinate-nucleotide--dimethylbenzimidazole phosphoribosyltransferase [Deltaproteobacteria bacterium]